MNRSEAPLVIEQVRAFLNTLRVPNEDRTVTDDLPALVRDRAAWQARLPDIPVPRRADLAELTDLRADLRATLGTTHPVALRPWLRRLPLTVILADDRLAVRHVPEHRSAAGYLFARAVDAVAEEVWARMKACPDCQWVFYDHSRNGTRRWCGMTADDHGRACGSIAKVRAYRARQINNSTPVKDRSTRGDVE